MKPIFGTLVILLMHFTVFAGKYHKAKIILENGTILEGLAELPSNPSPTPISFKQSADAKRQALRCDDIKTIIYTIGDNKTYEYDRMNIYIFEKDKKPRKVWLEVKQRGYVTLYEYASIAAFGGYGGRDNKFEISWFCHRQGEDVAARITSTVSRNKRGYFAENAVKYFQDNTDIARKITNSEYSWKEMEKIVEEYNEWKK